MFDFFIQVQQHGVNRFLAWDTSCGTQVMVTRMVDWVAADHTVTVTRMMVVTIIITHMDTRIRTMMAPHSMSGLLLFMLLAIYYRSVNDSYCHSGLSLHFKLPKMVNLPSFKFTLSQKATNLSKRNLTFRVSEYWLHQSLFILIPNTKSWIQFVHCFSPW